MHSNINMILSHTLCWASNPLAKKIRCPYTNTKLDIIIMALEYSLKLPDLIFFTLSKYSFTLVFSSAWKEPLAFTNLGIIIGYQFNTAKVSKKYLEVFFLII